MKRVVLLLGLAVVIGGAVTAYVSVSRERAYRRLIAQGTTALEADQTFEAVEAFSGAIAVKGDAMLAYLRRGETYMRQGQMAAAERDLRRAARLDPTATRPREVLGDVHFALRNYARAADSYADFIRLDDRSTRVLYKLALTRYRGGDPGGAVQPLRQAVTLDDRFGEAHYLLGLCLHSTDRRQEALRAFVRAISVMPSLVVAHEELAWLHREQGRTREALAELEILAALEPRPARYVALGLEYARTGQSEQAIRVLGTAAERFPEHPEIYTALGRVWLQNAETGRDRIALSKALEALQSVPVDSEQGAVAHTLFGRALLLAGDAELAERVLSEAVTRFPIDHQAFLFLADAAERAEHPSEARLALLKYQALAGDDPNPVVQSQRATRIAELSMRLSDPAAAAVWFRQASAIGNPSARLFGRLAEAQFLSGDREGARASLRRALDLDPLDRTLVALSRRIG